MANLQRKYFTETDPNALAGEEGPWTKLNKKGRRITDFLSIVTPYKWAHFKDRCVINIVHE